MTKVFGLFALALICGCENHVEVRGYRDHEVSVVVRPVHPPPAVIVVPAPFPYRVTTLPERP